MSNWEETEFSVWALGGGKKKEKREGSHLRADIETTALPISLGGEVRRQFRILIERHILEHKYALLTDGIDTHCTRDRWLHTACQWTKCGKEWDVVYLCDGERATKRVRRLGVRRGAFFALIRFNVVLLGTLKVRNGENQADPTKTPGSEKPGPQTKRIEKRRKKRDVLLISKLAMERDLVIARNVFDLTHENVSNKPHFFYAEEKKKEGRTVQIPEALNSLTDSGSPSTAPSFSYANSSAIFEDTTPSAVSGKIQSCQKKKKKKGSAPMGKVNTYWYLRRSGARIRRSKHGWLGC